MASKKSRTLFTVTLILAPLIAIVFLVAKSTPKTSPGMAHVLKTLHQDTTEINDRETSYIIDTDGSPYRLNNEELTYSVSAKQVFDRLLALSQKLAAYERIKQMQTDGPSGTITMLRYENENDPDGNTLFAMFELDLKNSSHVSVQTITRISTLELNVAKITGRTVQNARLGASPSGGPRTTAVP